MQNSITNEIKEYLFHLNYSKYSESEIFKILFFAALYSYSKFSRSIFCPEQRGTYEKDVKKMIQNFIKKPSDFSEIINNINSRSKNKELQCYYISISDLKSLRFSLSKFYSGELKVFFENIETINFEDTFERFKNLTDEQISSIESSKEQHLNSIEFITYLKKERKDFNKLFKPN